MFHHHQRHRLGSPWSKRLTTAVVCASFLSVPLIANADPTVTAQQAASKSTAISPALLAQPIMPQSSGSYMIAQSQNGAAPNPAASPASGNAPNTTSGNSANQQNAGKLNPESPNINQQTTAPKETGLFGDFGNGARSSLEQHGFSVFGHLVDEAAGNLSGGVSQPPPGVSPAVYGGTAVARGVALANEFMFGFNADFGKIAPGSGAGIVHLIFTQRFGGNLAGTSLGNLVSVQEIYGDGQTTRFTRFDYEQPLAHNHLNIELGKYNMQTDFGAGSSYWGGNLYCFYQNNNICGTPAAIPINNGVVPTGTEGYNYYPSSMWGIRIKVMPTKDFYIQAAALQANPIVNSPIGGAYFGFYGDTGTELPFETGLTFRNPAGAVTGDIRFGGYFDTSNVENYAYRYGGFIPGYTPGSNASTSPEYTDALAYTRGRDGAYVQFDHLLEGSSNPDKAGTAFFAAGEYSDPNSALIGTMYDAGITRHGIGNRVDDTVSVGFATEFFNKRIQNLALSLQAAGYSVPYTSSESALEFNYGLQATSWLVLRPSFQYVINPNGENTYVPPGFVPAHNAAVLGLQSVISF